jgi:hypothetical protein
MARVLDAISFNLPVQKVLETAEGYIINGHYYDKATLTPKPLKAFPSFGDIADLSMSNKKINRWSSNNNNCQESKGNNIVVDSVDPTICYVNTLGVRTMDTTHLLKIREKDGNVELITYKNYGIRGIGGVSALFKDYLGQDEDSIYYSISSSTTGGATTIVKISKYDLSFVNILALGTYASSSFLHETADHIFYTKDHYTENRMYRLNKSTNINEIITSYTTRASTIQYWKNVTKPIFVTPEKAYSYSMIHTQVGPRVYPLRYKIDFTKSSLGDIVVEEEPTITWGSTVTGFPVFTSSVLFKYEGFITEASSGAKYYNVAIYEGSMVSTLVNIPVYGIYTFLIDEDYNLIFKSFSQPSNSVWRGFLGVRNNTFLIATTDESTLFLNFDEGSEMFKVTESINNQPTHVGVDLLENIWTVSAIGEVEMFSPFIPTSIDVKYDKELYKYDGNEIDSNITIEAKNYNGVRIEADIELTIKGDAVFTSNSSKIILATTSLSGPYIIPVKIKGPGNITIFPKLVM